MSLLRIIYFASLFFYAQNQKEIFSQSRIKFVVRVQ